ncbi:MAG: aldo/keto reductase, partial [Bacteroidales bacterium]|nr:aldo/keto reductase [Bacteroidales bacterium]
MDRRNFLKVAGAGAVATAAVAAGCSSKNETKAEGVALGEVPTDKMTMRENLHGEMVSLLGYGCMRFPTIDGQSAREQDQELDQETVNELIDYAIAHGVNLFDTAPPYCKGRSEHAVGIALSRHKRDEYFVSTKLSNPNWPQWSREESIKMYHNSMKELQVDYIDYYMLHSIGGTRKDAAGNVVEPLELVKRRFFDNGMLDFLCEEREKGRIHNLGFSYHGDIRAFDYLLSLQDKGLYHWDHVLIQHNYVDWNHSKLINESNTNSSYLYAELEKRNIPVFVMEPLLGGQLVNLNDHAVELLKQRDPQASVASWA